MSSVTDPVGTVSGVADGFGAYLYTKGLSMGTSQLLSSLEALGPRFNGSISPDPDR
jgi:hypothetical protein